MRDTAARAADMSWPDANPRFEWPPPAENRRSRPRHEAASFGKLNDNAPTNTAATRSAQRAIAAAHRRLADLDRRADLLRLIGLHSAASRIETIAAGIRAEVLT